MTPIDILDMLPARARIFRETRVHDGYGGWTTTLALLAEDVPCRPAGVSLPLLEDVDGQMIAQPQRAVYFTAGTDIRTHDVIELDDGSWRVASAETQVDGAYSKAICDSEQKPA